MQVVCTTSCTCSCFLGYEQENYLDLITFVQGRRLRYAIMSYVKDVIKLTTYILSDFPLCHSVPIAWEVA